MSNVLLSPVIKVGQLLVWLSGRGPALKASHLN
jgi:hypothetical protein